MAIQTRTADNAKHLLCTGKLSGTSDLIGDFQHAVYPYPTTGSEGYWQKAGQGDATVAGSVPATNDVDGKAAFNYDLQPWAGGANRYWGAHNYNTDREYYQRFYANKGIHFRFTKNDGTETPKFTLTESYPGGCTGDFVCGLRRPLVPGSRAGG